MGKDFKTIFILEVLVVRVNMDKVVRDCMNFSVEFMSHGGDVMKKVIEQISDEVDRLRDRI